jgi:hypothetical protein
MGLVSGRRRISSWILVAAFACALAGSAATALAAPHACCPETAAEETRPPAHPCASLAPTACCQTEAAVHAPPSVTPPAALPAPPAACLATAPGVGTRATGPGAFASWRELHGSVVLRL